MKHRRKKSRRQVRCTLCTTHRWRGNDKGRFDKRTNALLSAAKDEIKAS